jgi:hypothetical protein
MVLAIDRLARRQASEHALGTISPCGLRLLVLAVAMVEKLASQGSFSIEFFSFLFYWVCGGFGMMSALSGLCSIDILRKPTQAYISIQESENMDSSFSFLKYFFNFEKSPFQV